MVNLDNLKKILEYERRHSVELYTAEGVHMWPLLRNALCWDFYSKVQPHKRELFQSFKNLLFKCIFFLRPIFSNMIISKSEAIITLSSQRRIKKDSASYSIYADPLADFLEKFKIKYLILEYGHLIAEAPIRPPMNITNLLKWRLRFDRTSKVVVATEPDWFNNYSNLCLEVMGREVTWVEVSELIFKLKAYTNFFEEIYSKSEAKYVFLICWFDLLSMASILAAKKLGVKSIEMQHGLQGPDHPAYSSWFRTSTDGYEMIPDYFWTWGKKFSAELKAANPAFVAQSLIISGGNLLLNQWRNESNISAARQLSNRILIVLQGEDPPAMVIDAIQRLGIEKTFIFRFHPARSEVFRKRDEATIRSNLGNHLLEFEYPEVAALYSTIERSDLLITEGSVVALEALAFGVKTIIAGDGKLAKQALIDYGYYIKEGNMEYVRDANELVDMLQNGNLSLPLNFDPSNIFSDQISSKRALKEILDD